MFSDMRHFLLASYDNCVDAPPRETSDAEDLEQKLLNGAERILHVLIVRSGAAPFNVVAMVPLGNPMNVDLL